MSNKNKTREEPKLNVDDFEKKSNLYSKKWPKDEGEIENPPDEKEESDEEVVGILTHPSYLELEQKLTQAEQGLTDRYNQILQLKAEQENIRRRAARDVENSHKYALEKFANDLLPVVDSLDRALESDVSDNEFAKKIHQGIELTMTLLLKTLEKFGIEQINPLNEKFNPEYHQAIATKEGEVQSDTVIEVLQKGYLLNGRLIRPALVVVSA